MREEYPQRNADDSGVTEKAATGGAPVAPEW
jgi:hypothetical protein